MTMQERARTILTEALALYAQPRRYHGEESFRLACSVTLAEEPGLGDLELLVCDAQGGGLVVSDPLDAREDWYPVGATVVDFLEEYVGSVGQKFWLHREQS